MNKMFKKIFAVVAACATVATMAVSAFAADYKPTDSAITVTPVTTPTDASMYTVMLFKTDVDVTDTKAVAAATPAVADIYYINQGTVLGSLVNGMLVKASGENEYLPEGNYIARIGNDKALVENLIVTVAKDSVKVLIGDVDGSGVVDTDDLIFLTRYFANWGGDYATLPNEAGAHINNDNEINTDDLIDFTRHFANWGGKYDTLPVVNE